MGRAEWVRRWAVIACLLPALVTLAAEPASRVTGSVFLDSNGNGARDAGDKGIAGVRVTDGMGFVVTDAAGKYVLAIEPDPMTVHRPARVVNVCWPTGTWPSGRWWYRLSEIKDAGKVDFALRRDEEQKLPFIYLHVTDDHGDFPRLWPMLKPLMREIGADAKFVVNTGDMGGPADMAAAETNFALPFFHAIGNHDVVGRPGVDSDTAWYGLYTRHLGPVRWSFDYAGLHFVGIDVFEDGVEHVARATAWLKKDLADVPADRRVLLFYHYPTPGLEPGFLSLLKERVTLAHAGHSHTYCWYRSFAAPMYTAYTYRGGNVGACLVDEAGVRVAQYCIDCKKGRGAHSRRCPIRWLDHAVLPSITGLFADKHTIDAAGEQRTVGLKQPYALVQAEVESDAVGPAGVRIVTADGHHDVTYYRGRLNVAGASFPLTPRVTGKTVKMTVFAHRNILSVWADGHFFTEGPVALTAVQKVSAIAEGASSAFMGATVQEIRADPDNKSTVYCCPCSHGGIQREPEH